MRLDKYKNALKQTVSELEKRGVEYVLVGSAVLPFVYKIEYDPGDLDIFILNKSTVLDNELFEEIARENDWDLGTSDHGTIYYELIIGGVCKSGLVRKYIRYIHPPRFLYRVERN